MMACWEIQSGLGVEAQGLYTGAQTAESITPVIVFLAIVTSKSIEHPL
jgi:hypothetical protein